MQWSKIKLALVRNRTGMHQFRSHKIDLYQGSSPASTHFRQYILPYNKTFAFTSFGVTLDPDRVLQKRRRRYLYFLCSRSGVPLHQWSIYILEMNILSLYFYDTKLEVQNRFKCVNDLEFALYNLNVSRYACSELSTLCMLAALFFYWPIGSFNII